MVLVILFLELDVVLEVIDVFVGAWHGWIILIHISFLGHELSLSDWVWHGPWAGLRTTLLITLLLSHDMLVSSMWIQNSSTDIHRICPPVWLHSCIKSYLNFQFGQLPWIYFLKILVEVLLIGLEWLSHEGGPHWMIRRFSRAHHDIVCTHPGAAVLSLCSNWLSGL